MSGWDTKRRLELGEEWPGFWIDLWEDPPMGAWLDLQEAAVAAVHNPGDLTAVDKAIAALRPLVAEHSITDREGRPLELNLRSMSLGLFQAVLSVIQRALGEGTPVPFGKKARSPVRSSQARRRPRATPSGISRAG